MTCGREARENDIIVATSEKPIPCSGTRPPGCRKFGLVADEVHLIDSPNRVPRLKLPLQSFGNEPSCQILALSATVGNANELAAWLKAELVVSEWRPTELREGYY